MGISRFTGPAIVATACFLAAGSLQAQADSALPAGMAAQYQRAAEEYRAAAVGQGDAGVAFLAWADYFTCLSRSGVHDKECSQPGTQPPSDVSLAGGGATISRGLVTDAQSRGAGPASEFGVTAYYAGSQAVGFGGGDALARLIQERWNAGARITLFRAGGGGWFAAMTGNSVLRGQDYDCNRAAFPYSFIERKWREGYAITDLDSDNTAWCVVMSTGSDLSGQTYTRETHFPETFIQQRWDEGYRITHVAGGGGEWAVVMSKGTHLTTQTYTRQAYFPADFIKAKWDEGYSITDLTTGNGFWVVVMSQGSQHYNQTYQPPTMTFPEDFIRQRAAEGYVMTEIGSTSAGWVVVMSRPAVWPE